MRSLFRLLAPARIAPKPATVQRDTVGFVLDDGRRIDILRVRDPRARRIKLSVDERGARLSLPVRASLVSGERFLHEHRAWLTEQFATQAVHAGDSLQRDITDRLPLRGDELPLRWQGGRATRLDFDGDAEGGLLFTAPASAGDAALQRALRDFYEAQGRADVGRWLPKYLQGLPRTPRRIVFKRTSTQWGSLAPDATLSLDLSLVLARPSAFEYVLVHELCHLLHADHSRRFWREVETRVPDWRDERTYFRDEGRALKARLRALLTG
ncbi:SprT family zinc-dependent metalloprotease [Thermomonas sp. HDW16]|uniref:M48 family metallopeptidase n=1 Tax=Thermomonas sp. HDW16 TaxID=2714945 RepID=UPI00140C589D|nr:SprT family zinc-dependent metalloprotease [Thermomonas sp. HDW16]QIL19519.1 M48 family metallopeptidase [Thermomonas sp. HDW16]